MNLDSLNKWLTLLANIGVLSGIIFLALEINQNTEITRAQVYEARSFLTADIRFNASDIENIAPVFVNMGGTSNVDGIENLTPVEVERLRQFHAGLIANYDNSFYQYQNGYLDDEYWQYVIIPNIKRFYPLWETLDSIRGVRPSFLSEMERIAEQ